jgi:hypothetical protein
MSNVSDDGDTGQPGGPKQVASIAAHRARRRHANPGPADPTLPKPAVFAALTDLGTAALEFPLPPDGSDVLRRLEQATADNGVIALLGEVMARITADDPATAAFWASLTGHQPEHDAPKPTAPRLACLAAVQHVGHNGGASCRR